MKRTTYKLTFLCTLLLSFGILRAQYVPIPDAGFGTWLSNHGYSSALTGNSAAGWQLDTTNSLVLSATDLQQSGDTTYTNITGVQYFKNLQNLTFSDNYRLTGVPPYFNATLEHLDLSNSGVTSLPDLPANLRDLQINGTPLQNLPPLPGTIQRLWIGYGAPKVLTILPDSLQDFDATSAGLSSLPPVPQHILYMFLSYNQLTTIPALPDTMTTLMVDNNALTSLTNLPQYASDIDVSDNTGLTCLPPFTRITQLRFSNTAIACVPSYNVSMGTPVITSVPLCSTSNPNGCIFQRLVYPGDANNDRTADNADLLNVGLGYGTSGPARTGAVSTWLGQTATDWTDTFVTGLNYKFADCDGNGTINADDTLPIMINFGMTHSKTEGIAPWRSGVPGLKVSFSQDTVQTGDTLITTFYLGDSVSTVSNIYGLAFTYHYDPLVNDTSSVRFNFLSSWLGTSANSISIYKDLTAAGQIKAAITGIDHISRSGSGAIAQMYSRITSDNINGKDLAYYNNLGYISDITAVDAAGHTIQLNAGQDSARVAYEPSGLHDPDNAAIILYPNPASGHVYIRSGVQVESVMLYNALGQTILVQDVHTKTLSLDLSGIAAGAYTAAIRTLAGIKNVRFIITQ